MNNFIDEEQIKNINNIDINVDVESFAESEIMDPRISKKIHECVTIRVKKDIPKDINIDFKKLLNINDDSIDDQFEKIKPVNIERRKVNGSKFFNFLKDFKVILSYMNENELSHLMSLRIMYENYMILTKTQINSIIDSAIHTFIPFVNRFIKEVDPVAYTPKCKTIDDKSLQELYFSEHHLQYLIKIIILSKITLVFTDCANKHYRSEAKKELSKKIWNCIFVKEDNEINMKNKIHKLINSRFVSTAHNEKRFWAMAAFANINIYSQANALYNELQTDSILMLSFDKNPLSFLDVFLKNTIYFISRRKFPLEYVLNNFDSQTANMNSELSTEIKFSIFEDILMKKTLDDFIEKKVKPLLIDKSIYEQFNNKFTKNILHFWIVIPTISRLLNISQMYLTSIDRERFIMLTIYVYYKLISMKCFNMASLLKSNMREISTGVHNEEVKNMSLVIARYLKSDELVNFLSNKNINDNITDIAKLVINPIICMLMNQYYSFDNDNKIDILFNDIINEYIRFLNYYILL